MASRRQRGKYRRYTAQQQRAALRDINKLGVRGAASEHDVALSTLGNWLKQTWTAVRPMLKIRHSARQSRGLSKLWKRNCAARRPIRQ